MSLIQPPYPRGTQPRMTTQAQLRTSELETSKVPAVAMPPLSPDELADAAGKTRLVTVKQTIKRYIPFILVIPLAIAIYFIWNTSFTSSSSASTSSGITQQNFGSNPSSTTNTATTNVSTSNGTIQVYIVGAVKHPGVYTLPTDARVFTLVQAAGGPLPKANLVALNMAAKLTDGEEVYVTLVGEIPPTYMGGVPGPNTTSSSGNSSTPTAGSLVNINTATVDELRQNLHVSSATANSIVNYRLQNGLYTSIDQLLQVISQSIYEKIKNLVTIS